MKEDNLNKDNEIIEPFIIVDLGKVKEKLNSISEEIKKSCSEMKKEVMVRYGGDCTFEDPIEDILSALIELDKIFELKKEKSSTCVTIPLPEDFACGVPKAPKDQFQWGSFQNKRNPISKRGKSKK